MPMLSWPELARNLLLARQFCDQILIHSLEGCIWQGFLGRLRSFESAVAEGHRTAHGPPRRAQESSGRPVG